MKTIFEMNAANQHNALIANDLERSLKAMAAPAKAPAKSAAPAPKAPNKAPDRDGLLGGLMFDCFLGVPLADMFADAADLAMDADPALQCGTAVDLYDEYVRDRANNNRTNGQKGVSGAFNGLFGRAGEPAARQMALENQYATIARMKRPPGLYMAA
jgi:hypothetical protein